MIIPINSTQYWKLLNIDNIIFKESSIDISQCNIKKLNTNLSYIEAIKYFIDIQNLIELLEKNNLTFFFIDINDFLIINDVLCMINDSCLIELNNDYYFTIMESNKPKKYIPPEFKYEIPLKLYKSFCYYQICCMLKDILSIPLENIKHTPLYYAINRGLEKNFKKRFLTII